MTPGPAYTQEYIDANLLAELDEYSDQYKWDDKLLAWALDLGRYEDKLYSIPYQLQTMLLYYNKTLVQDKGMEPPKSRDELESMAEELQGQGITPFAAGIGDDPAAIEWLPIVFWNHYSGPDTLYQALIGEIPFSDPVFVDAIALLDTYVQNGWFGGSRERFFSNGFDALHADLGDGQSCNEHRGLLVSGGHKRLLQRFRRRTGLGSAAPLAQWDPRRTLRTRPGVDTLDQRPRSGRRRRHRLYRLPRRRQEARRAVDGRRAVSFQRPPAIHRIGLPREHG